MNKAIISMLILPLLISCNETTKTNNEVIKPNRTSIQSINILTLSGPQTDFMEALISGNLVVNSNGCIRIEDHIIIWPYGYKLNKEKTAICNSKGAIIVKIGSTVQLSGGERTTFKPDEFKRRIKSELSNVCKGKYWIVGEEIKTL